MRIILLAFALLLFLLPSVSATISVSPVDDIIYMVDSGSFEKIIFKISNENTTTDAYMNISLDHSLEGVAFFSITTDDLFVIPANSSTNISCTILKDAEVTGRIYFTYNFTGNTTTTIDVNISIEENTSTSDDIILIPSTPRVESNLIFIIPERVDATGYVICYETNNAYIVAITDGIGSVELGPDYGEAFVSIFTDEHTYTQVFTIDAIFEDELFIDIPIDIQVDDTAVFFISASGLPMSAEVTFSMGNDTFKKLVNESGFVSVVFKKAGNWTINATVFNVGKEEFFKVNPKPLTISVKDNILVGKEIEITISKKSTVTVSMGDVSWAYLTDNNGKFFFTALWPGRYTVHATANDYEGVKQFTATMQTAVIILDADGIEAEEIQAHKPYSLRVVDTDGKSVDSLIKIYGDDILIEEIDADGSVLWKPDSQYVYYTFETQPHALGYEAASVVLYVKSNEIIVNSIDLSQVILVMSIVAFFAICVMIYFLKPEIIDMLRDKIHKRVRKGRRIPPY